MKVIFFKTLRGEYPVLEDVKKIRHEKTKIKIFSRLEQIERNDFKNLISSGILKKLHGYDLYESVVNFNRMFYRIFFEIQKSTCLALHIFAKKSNSTPPREIEIATNRKTTKK